MAKRYVHLRLTAKEAVALHQLATDCDMATFESRSTDPVVLQRWMNAGDRAIAKLEEAM